MRKCTSSESGVSLQRHANRPLPGKGIQTNPSGNLAPFTTNWPHRWLDLGPVCTALAVLVIHSDLLF